MDYFNYESKSSRSASIDSTPEAPSTPTIVTYDAGKSPSRPTCIRYSASFLTPYEIENSSHAIPTTKSLIKIGEKQTSSFDMKTLSSSLPSPPINNLQTLNIIPSLSLPSSVYKRRFSTPPHSISSPRLHILIVDDNSINLQVLSRLLSHHLADHIEHMELVKSGIKALEILKCRPFDLILMDIDMPIMNGIETTKHIRSSVEFDILNQNRQLPIIAVTTNDSSDWRQLYTKIGMNGCIGKPISVNDLKITISKVMGLHLPVPPYTPE